MAETLLISLIDFQVRQNSVLVLVIEMDLIVVYFSINFI